MKNVKNNTVRYLTTKYKYMNSTQSYKCVQNMNLLILEQIALCILRHLNLGKSKLLSIFIGRVRTTELLCLLGCV